jgi:hypothetical protein
MCRVYSTAMSVITNGTYNMPCSGDLKQTLRHSMAKAAAAATGSSNSSAVVQAVARAGAAVGVEASPPSTTSLRRAISIIGDQEL